MKNKKYYTFEEYNLYINHKKLLTHRGYKIKTYTEYVAGISYYVIEGNDIGHICYNHLENI